MDFRLTEKKQVFKSLPLIYQQLIKGGGLSLLSGVALWLPFHNPQFFPLAWVGLIPFLGFLICRPSWKFTLMGHGLMTLIYLGGVLYWIPAVLVTYGNLSWAVGLVAFLLMIIVLSLVILPFTLLTRWTAGKSVMLSLTCAPGFWLLTELCRDFFLFNGFPWGSLGYSQHPYLWIIQIADIGGVYLVSALLVGANASCLGAFRFRTVKPLVGFGILFLTINLYGSYRVYWWQPEEGSTLKVALVQPNIELSQDRKYYALQYYEALPEYYRRAVKAGAEWVIFPEAPNPFQYQEDFYFKTFWEREVDTYKSYLLFNTASLEADPDPLYFNSALLLGPDGKEIYRYDKIRLVPFGEYVPFKNWFGAFLEPFVQEVAEFSPGEELQIGSIEGTQFATLICYEGIFPELSRLFARKGAQVFVSITNDSWYGQSTAPRQHLEMILFRSIETRKPFLRCANSGYSATIDYLGRSSQEIGLFEKGVLMTQVAGNNYRTIYSYTGDWISIVVVVATFALALVGTKPRFVSKK